MSPPQCGPVSVSSQSEASDKASVCQAWRRCGVVSAAIPLSQQPNSATSMVVPIASQASTIVETNNQRHVSLDVRSRRGEVRGIWGIAYKTAGGWEAGGTRGRGWCRRGGQENKGYGGQKGGGVQPGDRGNRVFWQLSAGQWAGPYAR